MTKLTCRLGIYGPTQLDATIAYRTDEGKQHLYSVDVFLFTPKDLRPPDFGVHADWFFRDFDFRSSFLLPPLSLHELVDESEEESPINRLKALTKKSIVKKHRIEHDAILFELKSLLNIVRRNLEYASKLHGSPGNENTVPWLQTIQELFRGWEALLKSFNRKEMPKELSDAWHWCSEGIALAVDRTVLNILKNRDDEEELKALALEILKKPVSDAPDLHRAKKLPEDYRLRGEKLLHREWVLRKWSEQALYVKVRRTKTIERTAEAFLALAAAVAMGIALVATWLSSRWLSVNTLTWGLVAMVIYMLKDRIKEAGRRIMLGILPSVVDDRGHRVLDPQTRNPLGQVKERVRYPKVRDLPDDIRSFRYCDEDSLNWEVLAEDVTHYRKTLSLDARVMKGERTHFVGLEDTLRLDFRHWQYRLEEGFEPILYRGKKGVESFDADKVRHFTIIVRIRDHRKGGQEILRRARLIISRRELLRIEETLATEGEQSAD